MIAKIYIFGIDEPKENKTTVYIETKLISFTAFENALLISNPEPFEFKDVTYLMYIMDNSGKTIDKITNIK